MIKNNKINSEKKKPLLTGLMILGGLVIVFFSFSLFLTSFLGLNGSIAQKDKIAIVNIKNIIIESADVVRQIKKYAANKAVKAIVLRIESPGGSVAPSQEIYDEVLKVRKKSNKIVVTSMGNLAASGGYYIACASDKIVANPGTITGSIGVIMSFSNIENLMKKIGIKTDVIKSGKFKDIGSPTRKITDEERNILQGVIDDVYDQFINVVAKNRKIDIQQVKDISDGRIFTGRQALKMGLVDKLGSLEDAIELAGQMVGIKGVPKTVSEKKDRNILFELLDNKILSYLSGKPEVLPGLQFLWQF